MDVATLRTQFRGEVLTSDSAGYEAARKIWNAMIDSKPAAIARCTGPADVVAAVRFAAAHDLYPAIRAGGHNVAGLATVDGGFVIDLTLMRGIFVDPAARTATAQTGLTWGEFDREPVIENGVLPPMPERVRAKYLAPQKQGLRGGSAERRRFQMVADGSRW